MIGTTDLQPMIGWNREHHSTRARSYDFEC